MPGKLVTTMSERHFGVDLSTWQTNCDYRKAVKEGGVRFAILRAGYGKNAGTQKDNMFEEHYTGMRAQGIPLGAYQLSYALSVTDAKAEAKAMQTWISGHRIDLPIFLDMEIEEQRAKGKAAVTKIAKAWLAAMQAAGYTAVGIYANPAWFSTVLDADAIVAAGGKIWCASWGKVKPGYDGMICWQFGGETNRLRSTAVPGLGDVVDQDYYYGDLPNEQVDPNIQVCRATANIQTLDANGNPESGRYIAVGDICTLRLIGGPLIEVVYPTSSGSRTAYLKKINSFEQD